MKQFGINILKNIGTVMSKLPKWVRIITYLISSLFLLFLFLNLLFPIKTNINYSTVIVDKDSTLLSGFLSRDDKWRMYCELYEITPELKKAIVFKEDRFFYYHFGVNPVSVIRAAFNNITKGKRTSGASTITMQVARLLNPKQRTYGNKLLEMFRAVQLEWKFSKEELLQLYLNLVPYGGNVEGVKAASIIYFGKMPNHLSLAEIATLSIIPNRPVSLKLGVNNDFIFKERNKWLTRYKEAELFNSESLNDALREPLKAYRHKVPRLAPHLSYRLESKVKQTPTIYTGIDLELQQKCETIVRHYTNTLYYQNIKNAAVLVVDNASGKVLAYVGSADFYNNEDAGQVDGIRAVRSPGSTLKPLVYGMAIDKGLITPKTILIDVQTSYDGYEPENYDGKFYGYISMEDALAKSLNVPAVNITAEVGTGHFLTKLANTGFKSVEYQINQLGLSAVLGGCGATLEQLTTLYSGFANNGVYRSLRYTNAVESEDSIRILSPEASFMITTILSKVTRPDLPLDWKNSPNMPHIAWKTGTSYGRKDAWSIGYNNKLTVGVWVGNFSAEGVPELSGAQKATPLLFRIFNAIDQNKQPDTDKIPENIDIRYVCSQTGLIPGNHCKDLITDYYIPGISSQQECNHLKPVFINPDSTQSYCTSCLPEAGYKDALYPNLEPEMISYYENNLIKYLKIPSHNPDCERFISGTAPKIISPVNNNDYYINSDEDMQLLLSCQADNDVKKVFWYINQRFFKEANATEKVFFDPPEGKLNISCSDDKGRTSKVQITVKYSGI